MKTMCQFLIVAIVLYFCEQIDSASVEMKRSIVDGQGAALFFGPGFDPFCDIYKDLSPRQRNICRKDVLLMGSVVEGARLAGKECTKQFHNERWDCSSTSGKSTVLHLMAKDATKEAAFNHALVTAGIVHVMARNCMKGDLPSCHCSRAKRPQTLNAKYTWGGCGDNIQYASEFSRTFLNDPQVEKLNGSTNTKRAEKLLMDEHNKEVGRQAILKNRRIICKCHGATSHCSIKTCWYQVQEFNVISDYLKAKYRSALKVKLVKRKDGKKVALKAKNNDLPNNKLVYIEESPSYCQKKSRGYYSPGTVARSCNATTTGPGSCDYLCCGRGYKTERRVVSKNCRCKFHWCCDVKCEECDEEVEVHTCR